jgi:hypothetical protein
MKRFIFVTFIFLGWAFYVASGGAEYQPRAGSLQARVVEQTPEPIRKVSDLLPVLEDEVVTRTVTSLADLDLSKAEDTQVTLASVDAGDQAIEGALVDAGTDLEKVAVLTLDAVDEVSEPLDIRLVTGNIVNMRDGPGTSFERVGKVTKGTEIEVLEDPGNSWINILVVETGKTGWIADWLTTAAN